MGLGAVVAVVAVGVGTAMGGKAQTASAEPDFAGWMKFIEPDEKELAFQSLGWRMTLQEGIDDARRLGQPILLWTMNGHPLGCT